MNGLHSRSLLVQAAERRLNNERIPNRGDYILGAVGIVGCVVILILALLGVA